MREIELTISKDELKDKLGIKDVDMTPILESIASLKKELKKSPTTDNTEILNAIKLITNNKSDNSDIIKAIDSMASKIVVPSGNQELILRFDKLVDALNSQGMFRPSYNSYNPQIRNVDGNEINPATEEKQNTQISNQESVISLNEYTGNKEIRIIDENHICTDNSTNIPLGIDETFTGDWQDCLQFQEVNISISTDQNSATNGLVIEWSDDQECICDTDVFSVYADAGTNYTPNPAFRYVRVKYTNGGVAQTRFHLTTILRRKATGGSFHRITDTLKDDSDGRLNISVLKLRTAANNYVSGSATAQGNFKVSLEELESQVSDNSNTQLKTSMYGKTGDATFQVPRLDPTTHSLQSIDYAHKEIHTGSHYFICDFINPIQTGVTLDFAVTTPNNASWSHTVFWFASTLGASLEVYEGCSNVVGGTPVTAVNNNRNSTNTSGMTILKAPSSITTGTRISGFLAGANRVAGATSREAEVILKQNTTYLFRFTSLANSNAISFCAEWYEHLNKTA